VFTAHVDGFSGEAVAGLEMDIATLDGGLGPESFETAEMQVDGAVADDTAARKRDTGAVMTGEKWSHDTVRGPHFAHEIIGGFVAADFFTANHHGAAGTLDLGPEIL